MFLMRADRLVSLVLLLRHHGPMTADRLADELEVSPRTIGRDIEALSTAGVPVYAERGRHGGYALLPGFRTELTGLNHEETLAVMAAGSAGTGRLFGLDSSLASAVRKVLDALPDGQRRPADDAARRLLIEPPSDLLSRPGPTEDRRTDVEREVRAAVLDGRRLQINYQAVGEEPRWRTIDPIGLVSVRGRAYLLAMKGGADRTYRLSRIVDAESLADQAERSEHVDLAELWRKRADRFLADSHLFVQVVVDPSRRDDLLDTCIAACAEDAMPDGWRRLDLVYQDLWHAEWALWQLGADVEALKPSELRGALHRRAAELVRRYGEDSR